MATHFSPRLVSPRFSKISSRRETWPSVCSMCSSKAIFSSSLVAALAIFGSALRICFSAL